MIIQFTIKLEVRVMREIITEMTYIAAWTAIAGVLGSIPIAARSVRLDASPSSSVLVGETVTVQASADANDGLQYRFSVLSPSGSSTVLRDLIRNVDRVDWTPMAEGTYVLTVRAYDASAGTATQADSIVQVNSRIGPDNRPVVTPTSNPLLFLYSAPPCANGVVLVIFEQNGTKLGRFTPPQTCDSVGSLNFLVAGLEPNADYSIRHQVWFDNGDVTDNAPVTFRTGAAAVQFRPGNVGKSDPAYIDGTEGILLESQLTGVGGAGGLPVARKLDGTVVWYYDAASRGALQSMLRPLPGGNMFVVPSYASGVPVALREIDLAGNLVRETNVEAVSARLAPFNIPNLVVFHHDALRLPNGNILALANTRHVVPSNDPNTPGRKILSDVIVLLNQDFDVLWAWDAFQKLDVNRRAILGEMSGPSIGSLDPTEEDWTHGNALQYMNDGNILFSMRHQDWVVKIDFRDGTGSGDVLWKIGKDGDFTIDSTDPWPWFSHQHNAQFDGTRLLVYDNGNTRYVANGESGNSRGQVYVVDENARTARLELNADLGEYSTALGSAQRLSNGNYHFLSGIINNGADTTSQSVEVSPDGMIRYIFQVAGTMYRSFRMPDLFNPPE